MNKTGRMPWAGWGVLLLALAGGSRSEAAGSSPGAVLYFITTPEAEGGPEGARRALAFSKKHTGELKLRPVLLAHDWTVLSRVKEESPLTRTLRALEDGSKPGSLDIPLYDEEGLLLAEQWELRGVPAFVLVRGGWAHRMLGASSNLDALWECSK